MRRLCWIGAAVAGLILASVLYATAADSGPTNPSGTARGLQIHALAGVIGLRLSGQVDPPSLYEGLAWEFSRGLAGEAGLFLGEDLQTLPDGKVTGGLSLLAYLGIWQWSGAGLGKLGAGIGLHGFLAGSGLQPINRSTVFLVATASAP